MCDLLCEARKCKGGGYNITHLYIYNLYLYIYISLYLFISISLYLYISISLYLYISISLYLYISISLYLYISISLYLYLHLYLIMLYDVIYRAIRGCFGLPWRLRRLRPRGFRGPGRVESDLVGPARGCKKGV